MGPDEFQESADIDPLLRQAADGSQEALELLLARFRPYLRRVIELRLDDRLRGRIDVSDVVQEAELDAFRRIPDFMERRPMPFRLWLRKTAYERLIKLREQHGAARRSVDREVPWPERSSILLARQFLATTSSPSLHARKRELETQVRSALGQLAESDREILLMRYVEKLSNQEIGCILDLDAAAVSKRHGRALLRLQKILVEVGLRESDL